MYGNVRADWKAFISFILKSGKTKHIGSQQLKNNLLN